MKIHTALFVFLQCMLCTAHAVDAPPASAASAISEPVYVIAPASVDKQERMIAIDTPKQEAVKPVASKPAKPIQVWSGPVPLAGGLWLLVASMPVIAIFYFVYQIFLYFKTRRKKLSGHH